MKKTLPVLAALMACDQYLRRQQYRQLRDSWSDYSQLSGYKVRKLLLLAGILFCALSAHAATCTTLTSPTQSSLQTALNSCGSGNTLQLGAGSTTVTSSLTLPCGVTIQGPTANPATAEITTSTSGIALFGMSGGCTSGATSGLEYLHLNGAGPMYLDASNYSNIIFEHNQATAIPYDSSNSGPSTSLFFQGNNSNTDSNITIEYNTFGDANSCTAGLTVDDGGCSGITFNIVGYVINTTIEHNSFIHLNEGMHFANTSYCTGCTNSVSQNLIIEYNYFSQINRIPLENQISVQYSPTIMSNNVIATGNTSGTPYATIAVSAACCYSGRIASTITDQNPADYIQNNLIFQAVGTLTTLAAPLGLEGYGGNPQITNNLVQGYYCYGASWSSYRGTVTTSGIISYNTFQSPIMSAGASNSQCNGGPGAYIVSECGSNCGTPPTQSGNVEGATPSAVTSVAPTISPASGSQGFPLTVTLTDPGYTSGAVPLGNTGIWYTTDGSTPVPGSGTAQYLASGGTFVLPAAATVKAVGMWGTPPQPTSYPAGYGYVPSSVVTATYTSGTPVASVDYISYIGDVAYNTAGGTGACYSGFNIYQPIASDTVAGTHNFMAGNFSYNNIDGCSGKTDGEGYNYDTWDFSQGGGTAYVQQGAMENNIAVNNGSDGFLMENNGYTHGTAGAPAFFKNNTSYGNLTDNTESFPIGKGEMYFEAAYNITATNNLLMTNRATGAGGDAIYAAAIANCTLTGTGFTNSVTGNYLYSASGNNTVINNCGSFTFGTNVTGTSPAFASITIPGAPTCSSSANVPACMASMISNFTPTTSAAKAYGYQIPSTTSVTDPLYPTWLCTVTLPAGLVTPGCGSTAITLSSGYQNNTGNVNTLTVGEAAVQQLAVGQYSDGSLHNLPFNGQSPSWSSSNSSILTVTSAGLVSCIAPGTANSLVTATPSGVVFSQWGWTCLNPSLTGVTLACAGGSTTVSVGSSLTCTATCSYSGGLASTNCSTADAHGTDATFASSAPTIASVSASGILSGVAAGSTNLTTTAGSFTSSPLGITVTTPTPVLQGVVLNVGGASALNVGQTLQASATCNYSGSISTTCSPGPDTYGTSASGWASSNPAVATISGSGLITAVANGLTTFTVQANAFTSPGVPISVSTSPPVATLTGVTVTGPNSVVAGNVLTLGAQCSYSDGSTTNCQTTDAHGNVAASWTSSNMSAATVNATTGVVTSVAAGVTAIATTAGSFTSPNFNVTVTAAPVVVVLGANQQTTSGTTSANYINSTYAVTGTSSSGYNSTSGSFFLPAGTQVSGANWDLLVTLAPTGSTQASAPICKGTYTSSGTVSPNAWITVSIGTIASPTTACHLAPSTGYWIGLITNSGTNVPQGFYNCGSTCTGGLPTPGQNAGTYQYHYASQVYGTYSGNGTALTVGGNYQSSQYINLVQPPPTLTGGYQQSNPINISLINVGGTLAMQAFCQYSDGSTNQCFPTPDQYGNTILTCTSSNPSVFTVNAASSSINPCLVTGISGGAANVNVTLTGSVVASPYGVISQSYLTHPVSGTSNQFKR